MIHHEDICHSAAPQLNMDSINNMNIPAFSCQVMLSQAMSHVAHISTMVLLSISVM